MLLPNCRRWCLTLGLSGAVIPIGISTCKADDIPSGLFGKTISISYAESLQAKDDATGKTVRAARSTNLTIYISSQGRIFLRRNAVNNANEQGSSNRLPIVSRIFIETELW
jgi:hypothetical protein